MKLDLRTEIKMDLMILVRDQIDAKKASQKEIAKLLDVAQSRVSDLMKGKIDLFSVDMLLDFADKLGLKLMVECK